MTASKQPAEKLEFICREPDVGTRLDRYLAERIGQTRSQIKRLIDSGLITINGSTVKAGYSLKISDHIEVVIPEPAPLELEPEDLELEIVYQDADLAVINKPAGLVVHPGAGNARGTLVNALLFHCPDLSGIGGKLRPGIVHRLDKDTSGLLVVAKNDHTHQELAAQIKARTVKRHYLALVHGRVKNEQGIIDQPIGRHPHDRKKMVVREEQGRRAITEFEVKEHFGDLYTLVECRLQTGRTHQIRVHLAAINHPVVGDPAYGRKHGNLGCKRQLLHAFYLAFSHPRCGWMDFHADLPADFQKALTRARQANRQA
ncbi:MAG TPA: RluA family pseudouridine synthase [Firmicutes bacterium]|nr:RluA family pseudouridine synthase [Bacillota bacterium]